MPELVPVEGDPFLKPVEGDPFAEGMTLTGNVAEVAKKLETDAAARRQKLQSMVESGPGHVAAPNPYPPGSEEWEFYEQSRQSHISAGGAQAAWNTIGRGVPFAQPGSLGAAGGGIKAFHGSPHDFEQFDVSKIGTGEGAQSYGHGLYFAENPKVAEFYQQVGTKSAAIHYKGDSILAYPRDQFEALPEKTRQALSFARMDASIGEAVSNARAHGREDLASEIQRLKESGDLADKPKGHGYEVNINADPEHFLDWDKPLSEQHPKVQEALEQFGIKHDKEGMRAFDDALLNRLQTDNTAPLPKQPRDPSGEEVYKKLAGYDLGYPPSGPGDATTKIREAGIPGIKYLDQGSRNTEGRVGFESKYRAVHSLDDSHDIGERFFASRFKENNGDLSATIKHLQSDLATHPDDKTVQKTLDFAQNSEHKFTFHPPTEQTHNYVVFHHSIVDILKKYGLAGLVAGGAAHFKTQPHEGDPFADSQ